jgi:molybdopterin converting factor small subunit
MTGTDKDLKMEIDVDNKSTVLSVLQQIKDDSLRKKLFNAQGDPNKFVHVMLNGKAIAYQGGLSAKVNQSDSLNVLPAISGGSL